MFGRNIGTRLDLLTPDVGARVREKRLGKRVSMTYTASRGN